MGFSVDEFSCLVCIFVSYFFLRILISLCPRLFHSITTPLGLFYVYSTQNHTEPTQPLHPKMLELFTNLNNFAIYFRKHSFVAVFKWLIAAVWVAFINFSRTFLSNMFQEKFFTFCGHARMLITCLPSSQASRFFINSLPTAVLHVSEGTMFFTLRSRSCKNFYAKSIINLEWILIMVHQWIFKVYTVEPCYI